MKREAITSDQFIQDAEIDDAIWILERAKERFALLDSPFLCRVISDAAEHSQHFRRIEYSLRRWVMKLLDGVSTYESWLIENHPHLPRQLEREYPDTKTYDTEFTKRCHAARLAWIDWMIEELEKRQ